MAIRKYKSASTKIYYRSNDELSDKINKLCIDWTKEVTVKPSSPDMTTTQHCSIIHYWEEF